MFPSLSTNCELAMKKTLIRAVALTAALGSVALAQTTPSDKTAGGAAHPSAKMTPAQMKMSDERFLKAAYSGNLLEIKLSQYALEQVKGHEHVRHLAEMMIKDHEMANKLVTETAQKCGVALPHDLLPAHKAKLEMAMEVKGEMVHAPYLFDMAGSHVHTILCVSHHMHHTQDAAIKNYCAQVLPKIKMHFGMVKPLAEAEAHVTDMMK